MVSEACVGFCDFHCIFNFIVTGLKSGFSKNTDFVDSASKFTAADAPSNEANRHCPNDGVNTRCLPSLANGASLSSSCRAALLRIRAPSRFTLNPSTAKTSVLLLMRRSSFKSCIVDRPILQNQPTMDQISPGRKSHFACPAP